MSSSEVLAHVLAAAPVPGPAHVNLSLASGFLTGLFFLLIAGILAALGQVSKKFGTTLRAFSLLTYSGFVAIVNNGIFHNYLQKAATSAAGAAVREGALHHSNLRVSGFALGVAVVSGVYFLFRSGILGIGAGIVFGVAVLVAAAANDYQWLTQILSWWYATITP